MWWWAVHRGDQLCHAIKPAELSQAGTRGYAGTLCGSQLPAEGLEPGERPWGSLCLPCILGAADDLADPGRMGTAMVWRTCRECGSYGFLPDRGDRLCGGCLSLK
jgi:hypothetical protein